MAAKVKTAPSEDSKARSVCLSFALRVAFDSFLFEWMQMAFSSVLLLEVRIFSAGIGLVS